MKPRLAGILYVAVDGGEAAVGGQSVRKESVIMDKANKSIRCTVTSCTNHCDRENYCKLDSIQVGTHECNPMMDQCTDCQSFVKKN